MAQASRLASLLFALAATASASLMVRAASPEALTRDASLLRFLEQAHAASERFNNDGDPQPFIDLMAANVSLMGGAGGFERGGEILRRRLQHISGLYRTAPGGARTRVERDYLRIEVHGDVAWSVAIERRYRPTPVLADSLIDALRATTIYHRTDGAWRVVHRHADPLVDAMPGVPASGGGDPAR